MGKEMGGAMDWATGSRMSATLDGNRHGGTACRLLYRLLWLLWGEGEGAPYVFLVDLSLQSLDVVNEYFRYFILSNNLTEWQVPQAQKTAVSQSACHSRS